MYWYLVIGITPGNLCNATTFSRRWQTSTPNDAAADFFRDYEDCRRCIVTCIDTKVSGPQRSYVYDKKVGFVAVPR